MSTYFIRAEYRGIKEAVRLFTTRKAAFQAAEDHVYRFGAFHCCVYKTTNVYEHEYDYECVFELYAQAKL